MLGLTVWMMLIVSRFAKSFSQINPESSSPFRGSDKRVFSFEARSQKIRFPLLSSSHQFHPLCRIPVITDRMGPVGGRSLEAGEGPELLEGHGVPLRSSLTLLDGALGLGILGLGARLVLALAGPAMMMLLLFLMLSFLAFDLIHGPLELPLPRRPVCRPLGPGAGGEGPRLQEPLLPPTVSQILDGFLLFTGLGLIFGALMPFSIFSLLVSLQALA
ncbi:uncharacterized protein C20orf141 homolog [Dromiciops gliroides]|uniref:uncharacterized protein C20orf141 homolog n=1 Tax=Dromiciops gliroides TaxID=33562 RepID=UPI001CC623BD|nr:uncharacterized protein C20orf141 homolog [Dromiciops gliroides]